MLLCFWYYSVVIAELINTTLGDKMVVGSSKNPIFEKGQALKIEFLDILLCLSNDSMKRDN